MVAWVEEEKVDIQALEWVEIFFTFLTPGVPYIPPEKAKKMSMACALFTPWWMDIPIELGNGNEVNRAYAPTEDGQQCPLPMQGRLFQCEDDQFEIVDDQQTARDSGIRSDGILVADTNTGQVFLAISEFWQQFPKGIEIRENGFDVELFPKLDALGAGRYTNRDDEHIWYYYLRDDVYTIRQGVEKSHLFYIGFGEEDGVS